jgi:class 3 adenylate cyclase
MEHYDFIVIGSGPAGRRAAIQAAKFGKKVLVVERGHRVGGVSVHTGTIPSKTLRETALNLSGWRERGFYGRSYRVKQDLTAGDLRARLDITLNHEIEVLEHQFARNQVTTLRGDARFKDKNTIAVDGEQGESFEFSADSILLAVGLSVLLVRRATRPLAEISRQARFVGELDFDKVEHLPRNMVREIDQVFQAFNAMVSGLRAMNTYVPRSLFRKLMRLGVDKAAVASERDLTFIFTDIVGFTSMSENLTAAQTADILNEHFALLVAAVEREGGTVDKFIGDGMLAFWGAPDERADHALAAARACLGIAAALREGNTRARGNGGKLVRMRIGLHTGRVVVGNVGALDRWNYTVVGDAVNLCERLQSFGRDVAPQDEMVILASDTAVSRIQAQSGGMIAAGAARKVGTHRLRGRSEAIAVWRLDETVTPEGLCIPGSGIDLAG